MNHAGMFNWSEFYRKLTGGEWKRLPLLVPARLPLTQVLQIYVHLRRDFGEAWEVSLR